MLLSERPALPAPMLLSLLHPAQSHAHTLVAHNLDPMHQQSSHMMTAPAGSARFQPLMAAVRQRFGSDVSLLQVLSLPVYCRRLTRHWASGPMYQHDQRA